MPSPPGPIRPAPTCSIRTRPGSSASSGSATAIQAAEMRVPFHRSVGGKLTLAIAMALVLLATAVFIGLSRFAHETMLTARERAVRMASELFLRSASTPILFDDATGLRDTVA